MVAAGARSPVHTFTTAGAPGEPFRFLYFGDAQNDLAERWAPVVAQAYAAFPDAVGSVNAGDLVNRSNNDVEWTDDRRSRVHPLQDMWKVVRETITIRRNLKRGVYRALPAAA